MTAFQQLQASLHELRLHVNAKKTHFQISQAKLCRTGIFQHENDPKHTDKITVGFLMTKTKDVAQPKSNRKNLWWIIKRFVSKRKPKNLKELKAAIKEERNKIIPQQCERLMGNMPARIRAPLCANGRTTKY
uniref:Uncharacterized protein n=1 Tax=Amphiprion percula TaxID=161767 RepID=A0A3P8SJ44_AMPPE